MPPSISLNFKRNQLIELQELLERYCNALPVFGFKIAKVDWNLIKSNLVPIFVKERDIEPTVIKKANQFISFKFGDNLLFDIVNFHGRATSLDSFLNACKTSEPKRFFPRDGYNSLTKCRKMQNEVLAPYYAVHSKLRKCNPLEAQYTDNFNLLKGGVTTEEAVIKLKLSKQPITGIENYQHQRFWEQERMISFKDFLHWYRKIEFVSALDAMQKMIAA